MPIYEYVCQDCDTKYEKFIRSLLAKVELECPECGSPDGEKALSAFSTVGSLKSTARGSVGSAPACGPVG